MAHLTKKYVQTQCHHPPSERDYGDSAEVKSIPTLQMRGSQKLRGQCSQYK